MTTTALGILAETRRLLSAVGWLQHRPGNGMAGYSLDGALAHAMVGAPFSERQTAYHAVWACADGPLEDWNDKKGRSCDDVLALIVTAEERIAAAAA